MDNAFSKYHPIVNLVFFITAIGLGMFSTHPAFLVVSIFSALLFYIRLTKGHCFKFLSTLVMIYILFCVINAFINTRGTTVLFTYFNRNFTFEAFCYAMASGGIFISVLLWFSCYNIIMTEDKFTYLFGHMSPSISLIFSMVLRLVPMYKQRAQTIFGARLCVGKGVKNGKKMALKYKLKNATDVLSSLFSWSLEESVVTADSMKSRGYGQNKRTSFIIFYGKKKDYFVGIILMTCTVLTLLGMTNNTFTEYFPTIEISQLNSFSLIGLFAYAVLLLTPSILCIWEDAIWHISKSKI